jgi:hypothetical protein
MYPWIEVPRGESAPFGDQEPISRNTHCRVMMELSPTPAFEMPEAQLLVSAPGNRVRFAVASS